MCDLVCVYLDDAFLVILCFYTTEPTYLFQVLWVGWTDIVYVESVCRVTSMSMSGRLLYPFADLFYVQWPQLLQNYPKAKYLGGRLVWYCTFLLVYEFLSRWGFSSFLRNIMRRSVLFQKRVLRRCRDPVWVLCLVK